MRYYDNPNVFETKVYGRLSYEQVKENRKRMAETFKKAREHAATIN